MNWPSYGDPYYNADGQTRRILYNVGGIPDLEVDGVNIGVPVNFIQDDFDAEYEKPSFMTIDATYTLMDSTVNVSSTITPLIDFTGTIKAFIAVVENPTHNNATHQWRNRIYLCRTEDAPHRWWQFAYRANSKLCKNA